MGNKTPFYAQHVGANAKIVDFAGWDMPLHYGSQLEEHLRVRTDCGLFDVSHMGIVDVEGEKASAFLSILLANDIAKLVDGKALYSCMLNHSGGVIDDLVVYRIAHDRFRIVINAGRRIEDMQWINEQSKPFGVKIVLRDDLCMLAIQGPQIIQKVERYLPPAQGTLLSSLKPFHFIEMGNWFIARTGYTGEDGFEVMLPQDEAAKMWQMLTAAGIQPCGLAARDTLRLEAGLNLYGHDMDETVSPYESNLGWTVNMSDPNRQFIGRKALEQRQESGQQWQLVGLVLEGPGIIRDHFKILADDKEIGEVTSGGYSPTLEKSIALARVPLTVPESCYVSIRQKKVPAKIVKPPFVRKGVALV